MNTCICCRLSKQSNSRAVGLMRLAEQELASFFNAVKQLIGREQAELPAEDWLDELTEIDDLSSSSRDWRSVTVKASARFATRVNASSLSAEFTNA
jgi:hypothetical protein